MKVILRKDVQNIGRIGEIKQVKDGYARNFLLPCGLVEPATEGTLRAWKNSEVKRSKRLDQENASLQETAKRLAAITLSFSRLVSEDGVMFGSVAKSDIIKNLQAADIRLHKDMIKLPASIKAVGNFEVEIMLKMDIAAKVKVVVSAQSK